MKELINSNEVKTMSSLEMSELTEKRHDNVRRTIEKLADSKVIGLPQFEEVKNTQGQLVKTYFLTKRDSYVVVAQLSPEFTGRLVDRWQELEAKQKPMTTLQLLEHAVAEIKAKDAEIAKLNTIIDNELGYCSILRASIFLGVHEKTFSWRPLKDATLRLGMEVKRVPSPRFGYQNLYPLTAFREIYPDYDFDDLTPELVADKTKLAVLQ